MKGSGSSSEATCAVHWLQGWEDGGQLARALESWPFLPCESRSQPAAEAAAAYLDRLRRLTAGGLVMAARDSGQGMWLAGLRRMDWDSELFGFGVGRLEPLISPPGADPCLVEPGLELIGACLAHAQGAGLMHLSSRVDARDTAAQRCLQQSGFLLVDTIVVYELAVAAVAPAPGEPDVRPARGEDAVPLREIAEGCFGNRAFNLNRFNCDPAFPPGKVRELYGCWLTNSLSGQQADHVLVYQGQEGPAGFLTCKLDRASTPGGGRGQVVLNAVRADLHGRGIYGRLTRAALEWFRAQGAETVEIATQLTNPAVHRVWQRLGARMANFYHTFHVDLRNRQHGAAAGPGKTKP